MNLYTLLSYAWLAALAAPIAWAVLRFARWSVQSRRLPDLFKVMPAPVAVFALVSLPLWLVPLADEVRCRNAGLHLGMPVIANAEGVYWQSHVPQPSFYSSGMPRQHELASSLVRSLVEGRLSYIEVPYAPRLAGQAESAVLNQRLYFARTDDPQAECSISQRDIRLLPEGTCIAWETSQGINSRYQIDAIGLDDHRGHRVAIRDRSNGQTIASYQFRSVSANWTPLGRFGIRALQPASCTLDRTDRAPAAHLPAMVFTAPDGSTVARSELANFAASAWRPVVAPKAESAMPAGREGVAYLVERGQVRKLTQEDVELWQSATLIKSYTTVPPHAYMITGAIRLPTGLAGGHSVSWVIARGEPIPRGPRGHSTFYRVGEGCVWGPFNCQ